LSASLNWKWSSSLMRTGIGREPPGTSGRRRFVYHSLILAEVEVAQDGDHAELVGAVQDPDESLHVGGPEIAFRIDGGVLPRLSLGVSSGCRVGLCLRHSTMAACQTRLLRTKK
jgi:hypothetical protein